MHVRPAIAVGLATGALVAAGAAAASVASSGGWKVQKSVNPGGCCSANSLLGVGATSATNAWAVGNYSNGTVDRTLIERWNGKAWNVHKSPNVGGVSDSNDLSGVAAISGNDAWAVGDYYDGSANQTLIEHWNGKAWKGQKAPNVGGVNDSNDLAGVAAISPTNAWAVGYYSNGTADRTLIEHWNGKAWKVQKSPNAGDGDALVGVAATAGGNVWAVGDYAKGATARTLVERWNGKTWKLQKSPNVSDNYFNSVAATSSSDAWAVGEYYKPGVEGTLVERWNGNAWRVQKSPDVGGSGEPNELFGVTAISPTDAWAVGDSYKLVEQTLIEHWNGKAWKVQKSPNPGGSGADNSLFGVAASAAGHAWAVGNYSNGTANQTLVEHGS